MTIIFIQIYLIICTLFLAGKDASSYLLKEKEKDNLTEKRIQRWHRDGVILNILFVLPFIYFKLELFLVPIYAVLIRLSFFDIAFNKWSGLDYRFLGSTAWIDKIFSKIFGKYGAVKKSLVFLIILIVLNFHKWIIHLLS